MQGIFLAIDDDDEGAEEEEKEEDEGGEWRGRGTRHHKPTNGMHECPMVALRVRE